MLKPVLDNPWVRALGLLGLLVLTALIIRMLSAVLVPLFSAFIIAYMLDPVIDFFERRKVPRMAAVFGLMLLVFAGLFAIPLIGIPALIVEADELVRAVGEEADDAWLEKGLTFLHAEQLLRAAGWIPEDAKDVDVIAVVGTRIGELVSNNLSGFLSSHGDTVTSVGRSVADVFAAIGNGVVGTILFIGNFALFAFVFVYLLNDYDRIIAAVNDLIPPRFRPKVTETLRKIDAQLRAFLRGQMTVCLCLGVMYAIGLWLSGTPFALALAAFGAVASFVPYLGLALTIGPAVLLTLVKHGIDGHVAGVVLTFVIAQALEGNLLTPKIVGSQVGLGPVWIILAIMVFSSTLGFVGLLLAVPLAAVLKVLVVELVGYYKKSRLFEEPVSAEAGS